MTESFGLKLMQRERERGHTTFEINYICEYGRKDIGRMYIFRRRTFFLPAGKLTHCPESPDESWERVDDDDPILLQKLTDSTLGTAHVNASLLHLILSLVPIKFQPKLFINYIRIEVSSILVAFFFTGYNFKVLQLHHVWSDFEDCVQTAFLPD